MCESRRLALCVACRRSRGYFRSRARTVVRFFRPGPGVLVDAFFRLLLAIARCDWPAFHRPALSAAKVCSFPHLTLPKLPVLPSCPWWTQKRVPAPRFFSSCHRLERFSCISNRTIFLRAHDTSSLTSSELSFWLRSRQTAAHSPPLSSFPWLPRSKPPHHCSTHKKA